MNTKWRRIIILFLVFLTLFFLYRHYQQETPVPHEPKMAKPTPEETNQSKQPQFLITNTEGQVFDHLTFQVFNQKEEFRFEKKSGGWWMIFPVEHPAVSSTVAGLVNLLTATERIKPFKISKDHFLNNYGFDDPALRICTKTGHQAVEKCLLVGDHNPLNYTSYAHFEDEQDIFLLPDSFRDTFQNQSRYALLRKQIFPYALREGVGVTVQRAELQMELKKVGDLWQVTVPIEKKIDAGSVDKLLNLLNNLYIREFEFNSDWHDPAFGFDASEPVFIRLTFADGSHETIYFGKDVPGLFAYQARFEKLPYAAQISKDKVDEIFTLCSELLFRKLI